MAIRIKGILTLTIFFLVCMGASFYISRYMFVVFPVKGHSMEPTISHEEKVLVYRTDKIERGDIVVFESEWYNKCLVKRVIGLEGDTINIVYNYEKQAFEIFRNGDKLEEDYIKEPMTYNYSEREYEVPPGRMFFLGDNRNSSADSHSNGYMESVTTIQGKVVMKYKGLRFEFFALEAA